MIEQWQVGSYPVGNSENRDDSIFDDMNNAIAHAMKLAEGDEYAMIGIWELSDTGDASLKYLVCIDGVFTGVTYDHSNQRSTQCFQFTIARQAP